MYSIDIYVRELNDKKLGPWKQISRSYFYQQTEQEVLEQAEYDFANVYIGKSFNQRRLRVIARDVGGTVLFDKTRLL